MGQDISMYTDNLPHLAVVPNFQHVLPHLQRLQKLKPKIRLNKDSINLERELRRWLSIAKDGFRGESDNEECDDTQEEVEKEIFHLVAYEHYRTEMGSPSINRRSFTENEMTKFEVENDGFPLPSTDAEIKAFDQQVFIDPSQGSGKASSLKRNKKRDRQRSKSATAVPDLATIRLKLQKIQSPGKPKFIEHLINRVVSKRASRRGSNGLVHSGEETTETPVEPLSPDSEKCLQQAEAIVEELLSCSARPVSGESTDSGKGSSVLESTSDFSPTSKRQAFSTPASPTFHGIVRERLKSFQILNEPGDSSAAVSRAGSQSPSQTQKSYKNEEFDQELKEINKSIKKFYCSVSHDASFNSAVMESGYVKALVNKINTNKFKPDSDEVPKNSEDEATGELSEGLRLNLENSDSGWDDFEKEISETEGADNGKEDKTEISSPRNSGSLNCFGENSDVKARSVSSRSSRSSIASSSSSRENSRINSVSDSDSQEEEEVKPKDKLHQIAHELLTTERAYVDRLHLLDQVFHFRVTMENKNGNFLPQEAVTQMFANIKPIFTFHHDFLLPQLEARMQNWSSEQKIGDVMAKLAPFLKIYTEYVKNYDKAMGMIDRCVSQSPKFAALLQEIQGSPESQQLTLQHHMLGPIQRVPRYELLLKDYLKRLEPDSPDRPDAQKALDLVTEAARHSNTAMKKLDKFHKLLNIIPRLNGEGTNDLVCPTRELVKEGPITKISARSGEKQARYIFLFNDLLLVCSEQMMGSYKLRARLSVEGMEITAGENQMIQNSFCVKCIEKTIEFLDEANNGQGLDWFATFQQVAADHQTKSKLCRVRSTDAGDQSNSAMDSCPDMGGQLGLKSPQWVKDEEVTMCMGCQDRFTKLKRRHHCRACGKVFCAKCSSKKAQLQYDNNQMNRVCHKCFEYLKKGITDSFESSNELNPTSPKPIVQVHKADEASVLSGYLNVMDKDHKWTKRWIAAHEDFAMYFYKKHKDVAAIQTLPLPGHNVRVIGDSQDRPNVFSLTHKDANVCFFQAESEIQFQQWVRVLEKLTLLELPSEEEKRTSTHSDSSSQSNSSGNSGQSSQS